MKTKDEEVRTAEGNTLKKNFFKLTHFHLNRTDPVQFGSVR